MGPIDLNKPLYNQETYYGRVMHFFKLTNPLNIFVTEAQLDEAKMIVDKYKKDKIMPPGYTEEMLWDKKYLVDSAFHPDTGEKMIVIGRMAAQVPMNTVIVGGMLCFYSSTVATVFFQWLNQTFNAVVNYSNRSGDAPISTSHLMKSYTAACSGAVGTALFLNAKAKKMSNPLFGRLVPFAAVAAANFINIPMMRSTELQHGTPVFTKSANERLGNSIIAARQGIFLVCLSRCIMAMPGMTLVPLAANYGTRAGWFTHRPSMVVPFQLVVYSLSVLIATPFGCALFNQQSLAKKKGEEVLWYNKGL